MGILNKIKKVIFTGIALYLVVVGIILVAAFSVSFLTEDVGKGAQNNVTETNGQEIKASVMITGEDEIEEVSCFKLELYGAGHTVTITNSNVRHIKLIGNDNTVYYPKRACPVIEESGFNNTFILY